MHTSMYAKKTVKNSIAQIGKKKKLKKKFHFSKIKQEKPSPVIEK